MKLKRIFSVVLTIALMASLLAVPAFAAESKTLELREDWRLTDTLDLNLAVDGTMTIDGDGKYHIYEMDGILDPGAGTVTFKDGTILYPAAGDTDAAEITLEGIWDTKESNALMALRAGGHLVKIESSTNGTVTVDKLAAKAGDTVTVTAKPASGYVLGTVTVTGNGENQSVTVTNNAFTMPAYDVTISVTFEEKPAAPTFDPVGGTYSSPQTVRISNNEEGSTVYYTTDGSAPTASSTQYTAPITISSTTTLKAVALMGDVYSDVTSATYTISTGGGGGGGSSGSSSSSTTETTTNPDGSTTTTVTRPDGSKTETTKQPDGSTEVVETKKDGTVTTTTTDKDGNKAEDVKNPDGSSETTVTRKDGSTSATTVSAAGQWETKAALPAAVLDDAEESGAAAALAMPPVPVVTSRDNAPVVTVDLPAGRSAQVEIPVEDVTPGVVALLVHEDGTEEIIKTTLTTENGIAVTLSDGDTVKIVDNSKEFDDVPDAYWGADAVAFAASRELFQGTSATTFSPDTPMNRAMIVTVLARLEGVDTDAGANWYDAGAAWAVENGISDGSNMDGTLTREQLATMLYRYAQSKGLGFTGMWAFQLDYTDADAVSNYAYEAMCWTTMHGITNGVGGGALNPQGQATRVQVAAMLMRFISVTA